MFALAWSSVTPAGSSSATPTLAAPDAALLATALPAPLATAVIAIMEVIISTDKSAAITGKAKRIKGSLAAPHPSLEISME